MTSDPAAARSYLLGELTEERSADLEQAVLVDRHLQELVEEVEHDLIDDYVDGRLSTLERARFERHYMTSPVHRERVAVARALAGQARDTASPRWAVIPSRAWGWAVAALALLAIAAALSQLWRSGRFEGSNTPNVAQTLATPTSPESSAPESDRARPAQPTAEPLRVSLSLPAIATRNPTATTPRAIVLPGTAFVDLLLEGSTSELANVAAAIRSVDDRVVWTGTSSPSPSVTATAPHVARVSVPAERLPPDDYILTLTGGSGQILGRYFFRVSAGQ